MLAVLTGIVTTSITSESRDQSAIVGEDSCGDDVKLYQDFHKDMEDGIIAVFTDTGSEVGEIRLARDTLFRDTGIGSIRVTTKPMGKDVTELLHRR